VFLAGSVLHTFLHAFGANIWQKGLSYYLNDRFNNYATSEHLYQGLQRAVNESSPGSFINVANMMGSWEHQAGFPLIYVTRNTSHVTISQERFFYSEENTSENLWYVPLSYYTASTPDSSQTFANTWIDRRASVTFNVPALPKIRQEDDWIIFNTQQVS
jgi:aminopeptidase N